MHPFPLIEALWASLDPERPSGDDPARVVSALSRFFQDFQRNYQVGRRHRWKTPLFLAHDEKLLRHLQQAVELTTQLSHGVRAGAPELEELRQLDREVRQAVWALEQEERGFGLTPHESPKLRQLDYLFEGWLRGLLPVEPLEDFLQEFLQATAVTRQEIASAVSDPKKREKESDEEARVIASTSDTVDRLEKALRQLQSSLPQGPASCRPLRDAILQGGQQLGESFHQLEKITPAREPCPFCDGDLSLSGRCRQCGRRLPHLEEVQGPEGGTEPESPFVSNNLRQVDLALSAFDQDPDDESLWKAFQEAVRHFGKQVDAGRQQVEMLANSPDRPLDSSSKERLDEAELAEISAVFTQAQRVLASFAFQPFPPEHDLPDDWRQALLAVEPRLQALERRWKPQDDVDPDALPSPAL